MPRTETVLSVFVASPGDVSEERDSLDAIIGEINSAHARRTGIRLELLRWEDVLPALGEEPQAVINAQIPQDYDVFVGIFWNRLGTPTILAESGTAEEYYMAKARFDKNSNSVRLMLYFKVAPPLTMDGFDPDQYKKVQEFRSKVGKQGLYRKFKTLSDFENHVRLDLTKLVCDSTFVHDRRTSSQQTRQTNDALVEERDLSDDEGMDEVGLLDLEETFEEEMDSLNAALSRMNDSISNIGTSISQRVDEIHLLNIPKDGRDLNRNELQKIRADTKRILKRSSRDMDLFASRMRQDAPLFRQHLDKSINVFTKAVPMYLELKEENGNQELIGTINPMLDAMNGMLDSMEDFRDAVSALPRLTTTFVRSRRETEKVLQDVIDITRGGYASLEDLLSVLR